MTQLEFWFNSNKPIGVLGFILITILLSAKRFIKTLLSFKKLFCPEKMNQGYTIGNFFKRNKMISPKNFI